nr:caspase-6-like [Onthophagus taurus]
MWNYQYDKSCEKQGKALIFNLYSENEGGSIDVTNLTSTLGNYYGFDVEVCTQKTYNEIHNKLTDAGLENYEKYNCIMVVMLAHGNNVGICAEDQTFQTSELWVPFTKCTTLIGKPKIFLIQACRGNLQDSGLQVDSSRSISSIILPRMTDILIIYSCFEGYVSYITSEGTPFIKELCKEMIKEDNRELEFCQILTIVNYKISSYYNFGGDGKEVLKKQAPTYVSSLRKGLYFSPKIIKK